MPRKQQYCSYKNTNFDDRMLLHRHQFSHLLVVVVFNFICEWNGKNNNPLTVHWLSKLFECREPICLFFETNLVKFLSWINQVGKFNKIRKFSLQSIAFITLDMGQAFNKCVYKNICGTQHKGSLLAIVEAGSLWTE